MPRAPCTRASTARRCARSSAAPTAPALERGVVCDQTLLAGHVFARQHDGLANRRMLAKTRFDLTELDPETANLDLKVVATQKLDVAVVR